MAVEEILQRIGSNASQSDPGALEHLAATLEMTAANPIILDLRSISYEVLAGLLLGVGGWECAHHERSVGRDHLVGKLRNHVVELLHEIGR